MSDVNGNKLLLTTSLCHSNYLITLFQLIIYYLIFFFNLRFYNVWIKFTHQKDISHCP